MRERKGREGKGKDAMGGTEKKEATGKKRMYLPISKTD